MTKTNSTLPKTVIYATDLRTTVAVAVGLLVIALIGSAAPPAQAQTFTILHSFAGPDGKSPYAGVTMDQTGNLYGTTFEGGNTGGDCGSNGCGTVFELKPEGSGWILHPLYTFSGPDGANPTARVIIGPDGNLYGTTGSGGAADLGTVFRLRPPAIACKTALCPWTETVLHSFQGGSDGELPQYGDLVFDQQGNIYGTAPYGGSPTPNCSSGCGVAYELTPSNGGWTESILYRFQGENDGGVPFAGLIFDTAGNLYGTTALGGTDFGVVYMLSPSEGGWTESVIYTFPFDADPYGGLIFDQIGNLYGITNGPTQDQTVVYELTPAGSGWTFNQLYSFYVGSFAKLTMDPAGNLYGTLFAADLEVFRLTPSNGQWTQTGFTGGVGDFRYGSVILDASGNVYATASGAGSYGVGAVFEITL